MPLKNKVKQSKLKSTKQKQVTERKKTMHKEKQNKTKTVMLRITPDMYSAMNKLSMEKDISMPELARKALKNFIKKVTKSNQKKALTNPQEEK